MSHLDYQHDSLSDAPSRASRVLALSFIALVLTVNLTALGVWLSTRRSPSEPAVSGEVAGLTVDPNRLDIGPIWSTPELNWTLPIRNNTDVPVTISQVYKDCACAAVEPLPLTIPPNESLDLSLEIDLTSFGYHGGLSHDIPFAVELLPRLAPPSMSPAQPWRVHGTVRRPVLLSQPTLQLQDVFRYDTVDRAATVEITCHPLVQDLSLEYDEQLLDVSAQRRSDRPLTVELRASVAKGQAGGLYESTVMLITTCASGEALPKVPLKIRGRILEHVAVSPPNLALGRLNVGNSSVHDVRIWSPSGASFSVESVEVEGSTVLVEPSHSSPANQAEHGCLISVTAHDAGSRSAIVRFAVTGEFPGSPLELPLRVSYYGVAD